MGVVYSARDIKLNRRVAIKVLPPDLAFREEIRKRFLREAQTAARLSHPHIVPIHSVGDDGGLVYFVMGYVDGESLGARLRRRKRLPIEEVRRIMKETADALGLAHTMAVVHRDIKPDNILLDGTRRRVMVTDFGIAKALYAAGAGTLTATGVAIGTPSYMSPEQAAGESEVDSRSDVYSLGVVGYEMITGELPFNAPTVPAILLKQISEPPPDPLDMRAECPQELAASVLRCLEKDPSSRWPTADALRRALESRTSVPYKRPERARPYQSRAERRPIARPHRERRDWRESRAGGLAQRRAARPERPSEPKEMEPKEPKIVRKLRGHFASYVSVNGSLLLVNVMTGIGDPWFLWCAVPWAIFGLAPQYGKLWTAGYSWRDVIQRPPAKDAIDAPSKKAAPKQLPEPSSGDFGKYASQVAQMQGDRAAIVQIVNKLPKSESALLPDIIPTVESLYKRASDLGHTLKQMEGEVDSTALERLDQRIVDLEAQTAEPERDRRLELMKRQRQALGELVDRKSHVEAQFESCVLAIQNVRYDLLRLRSAGVGAVLDDLTSATQQARALAVDVNAAIDAAGEIRELLGKSVPKG